MATTAEASPELKRLAGGAATGRKLEKPVCHYSLNWAKDEKPDRQEMRPAAAESLKALGLERHQALIVSHRDGQPHVHVIANRVEPESGKAAGADESATGGGAHAHLGSDRVETACRRSDLFERRRMLMADWVAHVTPSRSRDDYATRAPSLSPSVQCASPALPPTVGGARQAALVRGCGQVILVAVRHQFVQGREVVSDALRLSYS